jgi:hypothetical protein
MPIFMNYSIYASYSSLLNIEPRYYIRSCASHRATEHGRVIYIYLLSHSTSSLRNVGTCEICFMELIKNIRFSSKYSDE